MSKTEQLLGLAADSMKMPGWDDGLSMMVDSVRQKTVKRVLSMEDLQQVAGGVGSDEEIIARLKANVLK